MSLNCLWHDSLLFVYVSQVDIAASSSACHPFAVTSRVEINVSIARILRTLGRGKTARAPSSPPPGAPTLLTHPSHQPGLGRVRKRWGSPDEPLPWKPWINKGWGNLSHRTLWVSISGSVFMNLSTLCELVKQFSLFYRFICLLG